MAPVESLDEAVDRATHWWDSDVAQEWLIQKPISIGVTLLIAAVVHWLLRRIIAKFARKNIAQPLRTDIFRRRKSPAANTFSHRDLGLNRAQEERRQSRVKTLAAVGQSAVAIVVWTLTALVILDTLGVNIGPLVASAGVLGVALGFGAQSLVKDFLSGIFMLIEDQYGVGDTINVSDEVMGEVEDISLRITSIRDIDGALWHVRNGEILRVGNFSAGYSVARLEIPVALTNDSEKAWAVIEKATREACEDPDIADLVLEKPDMQGVSEFATDHLRYRISINTLPGRQWTVQRFVQGRILDSMSENDIAVPYPKGIAMPGSHDQ